MPRHGAHLLRTRAPPLLEPSQTTVAAVWRRPGALHPHQACNGLLHDVRQTARLGHRGHVPVLGWNSTSSAARAIVVDRGRGLDRRRDVVVLKVNTLDGGDAGDLNHGVLTPEIDRRPG